MAAHRLHGNLLRFREIAGIHLATLKEQGEYGVAGAGLGRSAHEEPESPTP
jgi:hypothetical protein